MIHERRYQILGYIIENPGLKGLQLARVFKISGSSFFKIIYEFESIKIIVREKNGRTKKIFVTEKGLETFKNLQVIYELWR